MLSFNLQCKNMDLLPVNKDLILEYINTSSLIKMKLGVIDN